MKSLQEQLNSTIKRLPKCLLTAKEENFDALIEWVKDFAQLADDVRTTYDNNAVAKLLDDANLVDESCMGQPAGFYKNKKNFAKSIIYNMISCIKRDAIPQNVAVRMADEYAEMA